MNRIERHGRGGEARLRYLDGDFQVMTPGTFVCCAVTGLDIPLDELKYWDVARQEAYVDAPSSLARFLEARDGVLE
ncbi:MAG: DUF2093 domain-containing protein [Hyphomicrobiales bacterium]|nr:DUF2093 domain-containing protein [Hyphomicrobiales bacterium]